MSVRETRSVTIRVRQEVGEGQRFCISVFHNYTLPRKGGKKTAVEKRKKRNYLVSFCVSVRLRVLVVSFVPILFRVAYIEPAVFFGSLESVSLSIGLCLYVRL